MNVIYFHLGYFYYNFSQILFVTPSNFVVCDVFISSWQIWSLSALVVWLEAIYCLYFCVMDKYIYTYISTLLSLFVVRNNSEMSWILNKRFLVCNFGEKNHVWHLITLYLKIISVVQHSKGQRMDHSQVTRKCMFIIEYTWL